MGPAHGNGGGVSRKGPRLQSDQTDIDVLQRVAVHLAMCTWVRPTLPPLFSKGVPVMASAGGVGLPYLRSGPDCASGAVVAVAAMQWVIQKVLIPELAG